MSGPYTLQGKSLPVPPKLGEVLCHKQWSDRNSTVNPRDVKLWMVSDFLADCHLCGMAE